MFKRIGLVASALSIKCWWSTVNMSSTSYHLSYTNRDVIKLLMSSTNEALERSTLEIPHLASTDGKSNICLVGTRSDEVSKTV